MWVSIQWEKGWVNGRVAVGERGVQGSGGGLWEGGVLGSR